MNKNISSTSSKNNKKKKKKLLKTIKNIISLFAVFVVIVISFILSILSLGDLFTLMFDSDYKLTKADITDRSFTLTDEKFQKYKYFKLEVSYEFNKDNKIIKSSDVILSPTYYIIHKFKDDIYILYNVKDNSDNHIFQIYFVHLTVAIILLWKSIMDVKHFIKYKTIDLF